MLNARVKLIWQLVIVSVILLIGVYLWFFRAQLVIAPVTQNNASNLSSYIDPSGSISFSYDKNFTTLIPGTQEETVDWRLDAQNNGIVFATLTISRSYMTGTNFSEARMTFGRSSELSSILSCIEVGQNEEDAGSVLMGGLPFHKIISKDAAAGNFYEVTSYRGILDGDCYVIEYFIHSTNIGNYSPDQNIKEFDKVKVQAELEKVVQSFKFLLSSE